MRWPRRLEWWHYAAAGAAGLALLNWKRDEITEAVEVASDSIGDLVTRGKRLSVCQRLNAAGQVPDDPAALLAQAAYTVGRPVAMDAYAIARMLRAEGGSGPVAEKQARAWVAVNDAFANGWTMLYTIAGPDGLFGRQRGWRYASGRDDKIGNGTLDPYENDLYVAEAVLSGALPDNTGHAEHFVDISGFGVQEGTGSYAALVESWGKNGLQPFEVEGARSDFRVFRKVT